MFVYFIFCSQNQNYLTSLLKKSRPTKFREKQSGRFLLRKTGPGRVGRWMGPSEPDLQIVPE